MTHITAVPSPHYTDKNIEATSTHTFLTPGGISDTLLDELLHHGEKVCPTKGLPALPAALPAQNYEGLAAIPSFGASMLQSIVQLSSQLRRQSAETRALQFDSMAKDMEHQATSLHAKAASQQSFAIASGVVGIAVGAVATVGGGYGLYRSGNAPEAMLQALNNTIAGVNATSHSITGIIQGSGQSIGTLQDEAVKLDEAAVERKRAGLEYMKSMEEHLRDLIAKAIATQDAIQQNTNQTRTKILG